MFVNRPGNRFEACAPATLTNLIGIDKIVGRLATLLAVQRHRPRNASHVESARERLPLNPLDELHRDVAVVIRMRFFRSKEEGPRTKQQRHAHDSQDYDQRH